MTLAELEKSLRILVDYNWEDELEHYQNAHDWERTAHIFKTLVKLHNFLNDDTARAEEFVK